MFKFFSWSSVALFAWSAGAFFIFQDGMRVHPVSAKGPWFEGWYYRIYDPAQRFSWVMIATSAYRDGEKIPGYLSTLVQYSDEIAPRTFEVYPSDHQVKNLADENDESISDRFYWQVPGLATVTAKKVKLNLPEVNFSAEVLERIPWDSFGIGPGGPMRFIKGLPLYWYVDNTGGKVRYRIQDSRYGQKRDFSGEGFIHQEKNWGKVFPSAWMWVQAISDDGDSSLALAGGRLPAAGVELHSYMLGFKTPRNHYEFSLAIDSRTQFLQKVDPCLGSYVLEAVSSDYRLRLEAIAPVESFGFVSIPTENGYQPEGGIESFRAQVRVEVFRNDIFSQEKVDEVWFENAALEFGADYMICEN